jgi:hypothetical protein
LLLAAGLTVGLLPATSAIASAGSTRSTGVGGPLGAEATRRLVAGLPTTGVVARADGVHASAVSLSDPDPAGDATTRADITKVGARLTGHSLRLSVTVPGLGNPFTDPVWDDVLKTNVAWGVDSGGDGTVEKAVLLIQQFGGLDAWVVSATAASPVPLCAGNASFDAGGILSVQVPSACFGSPAQITFGALVRYNWTESTPTRLDGAPDGDAMAGPITSATTPASKGGAVVLESVGELYRVNVGGLPSSALWSEYASLGTARGLAVTPDGGHGYVLSGSGRLFGISFGRNNLPPRIVGAKSWPNQNVARGVAIRPNGSAGLVVDRFGNLFPFGVGGSRVKPTLLGVPIWPGVDMARGLAVMPDGSGGFTLDAFGGLNWFSIGAAHASPGASGGPAFATDRARGVGVLTRLITRP